jgi:hypothetical protein
MCRQTQEHSKAGSEKWQADHTHTRLDHYQIGLLQMASGYTNTKLVPIVPCCIYTHMTCTLQASVSSLFLLLDEHMPF